LDGRRLLKKAAENFNAASRCFRDIPDKLQFVFILFCFFALYSILFLVLGRLEIKNLGKLKTRENYCLFFRKYR